jgi:hypothetical protein
MSPRVDTVVQRIGWGAIGDRPVPPHDIILPRIETVYLCTRGLTTILMGWKRVGGNWSGSGRDGPRWLMPTTDLMKMTDVKQGLHFLETWGASWIRHVGRAGGRVLVRILHFWSISGS